MAVYLPKRLLWAIDRSVVSRGMGMESYARGRKSLELFGKLQPPAGGVAREAAEYGGVPGITFRPEGTSGSPRLVFLHGGGYCYGSPTTHLAPVAYIAKASGCVVFSADYPLAPENPHPAATNAALSAFESIADEAGLAPALAGDSAGGGLALCTAIAARGSGSPAPPAIALISPFVDLTNSFESIRRNAGRDALLKPQNVDRVAKAYAGELERDDPGVSPINADLADLPPVLIQTGSDELLLDEGVELGRRLEAAGVETSAKTWPGMWHDFQVHAGMLREADEAVAELGEWVAAKLAAQPESA